MKANLKEAEEAGMEAQCCFGTARDFSSTKVQVMVQVMTKTENRSAEVVRWRKTEKQARAAHARENSEGIGLRVYLMV